MAPAFSSRLQALGFAILLLAVIALPAVCCRPGLFSRASAFAAMPVGAGDFAFMRREIFEEKSDLDMVLFGPSGLIYGIDAPYIQQQLSAHLGRPARVITVGSFFEGEDRNYFILRELLEHRRVKLLVLKAVDDDAWQRYPDFSEIYDQPHPWLYRFFQLGDDWGAIRGLPFRSQAALYAGAILGAPRHLLSFIRSDLTAEPRTAPTLGADPKRKGYDWRDQDFEVYQPEVPPLPPGAVLHSAESWTNMPNLSRALKPYPVHFERKIGELLRAHRVHLAILHMPFLHKGPGADHLAEIACWPDQFGVKAELIGAPEDQLFAGMSDHDIKRLFGDFQHLNANGARYFTKVITPALIEIYDKDARP